MNLKTLALIFGAIFTLIGIAGFVPALSPASADTAMVFGIFAVNTLHNTVHLAFGLLGLALGAAGENAARNYFRIVGVVYGLVAVLGFVMRGDVFGIAINMADNWLHVALAAAALFLGFAYGRSLEGQRPGPAT